MQFRCRCACDVITFILHTFYSEWLYSLESVNSWGYFCVSFLHNLLLSRESNSITNMSIVHISDPCSLLNHAAMQNWNHYKRQSKVSQKDISTAKVSIMLRASFDLTIDCLFIVVCKCNLSLAGEHSQVPTTVLLANLCKIPLKYKIKNISFHTDSSDICVVIVDFVINRMHSAFLK